MAGHLLARKGPLSQLKLRKRKDCDSASADSLPHFHSGKHDASRNNALGASDMRELVPDADNRARVAARRMKAFMPASDTKLQPTRGELHAALGQASGSQQKLELSNNCDESSWPSGVRDEGDDSSFLTEDDKTDGDRNVARSSLSSHPSHAGYLTSSSSDIKIPRLQQPHQSELAASPVIVSGDGPSARVHVPEIAELVNKADDSLVNGLLSPVFLAVHKLATLTNLSAPNWFDHTNQQVNETIISEEVNSTIDTETIESAADETKQPAVKTLGQGDLSLRDLGVFKSQDTSPKSSVTDLDHHQYTQAGQNGATQGQSAASTASTDCQPSIADGTPSPSKAKPNNSLRRLGHSSSRFTPPDSIRGRLMRLQSRRGSSATGGSKSSTAVAAKESRGAGRSAIDRVSHETDDLRVANRQRDQDFHRLFRNVSEDERLIEDYSATLQRDVPLHGRLYISESHVCFYCNTSGSVTSHALNLDQIVSVKKKNTAMVVPNALVISTIHERHKFVCFKARDSMYELLVRAWKIRSPNRSYMKGVAEDDERTRNDTKTARLRECNEEPCRRIEHGPTGQNAECEARLTKANKPDLFESNASGRQRISRNRSIKPQSIEDPKNGSSDFEAVDGMATDASLSHGFHAQSTHVPTQCSETAEHYDHLLTDEVILAPLGQVYSVLFGPASAAFMRKWLIEDRKAHHLNFDDDHPGLDNRNREFTFDYVRPLSAPVGPKQTKCITTNTLKAFDLDRAVSVESSTKTPDVPGGSVFAIKTRYCLMWGPGNSTRLLASCAVEWTGKSWLKGPIERSVETGQRDHITRIIASLKTTIAPKTSIDNRLQRDGSAERRGSVFDSRVPTHDNGKVEQNIVPKIPENTDMALQNREKESVPIPIRPIAADYAIGAILLIMLVLLFVSTIP